MTLRQLLAYAWPYRGALALSAMLMLAETAAALAVPWFGGLLAGGVIEGADVVALVALLLALFAAQAVLAIVSRSILGRVGERILADLRIRVYDHLQSLPIGYFHERRRGDLLALITQEVAQLSSFLTGTLVSLLPLLVTAAGAALLMFRLEPRLGLAVAALVPAFYLVLRIMGRRLRPLALETQRKRAAAVAVAEENLEMLPVIKAFAQEGRESDRYSRHVRDVMELVTTQLRIQALIGPTIRFLAAAAVVLLLWFASTHVEAGAMTPEELVSFLLYAALLTRPVGGLAGVYGNVQLARGSLERLQGVLEDEPEAASAGTRDLPRVRGEIAFEDVSFAYPGREPALRGLNLRIAAGETVAVTGRNGAGKSTLVHLLMRLHRPSSGAILIDGIDIATVTLSSLRRRVGLVPQQVLLVNASVRENIAFGRPEATEEEIVAAARAAQAHELICRLPEGYDTAIGDQGVRLSGGQRQRIALARALLTDPPILILDEATAMFDPEGERSLTAAFRTVLAGRTVILITHRPETLSLADRIVRLEAGAVADSDAPAEGTARIREATASARAL